MAVSPAAAAHCVLLRKVLRVIDQNVGAFGQLAHAFVELRIARFVVGCVHQHAFFRFDPESQAPLRMIQPRGLDADAVFHVDASVFDIAKTALRAHLVEIHRKVRRRHLLGHHLLNVASPSGRMKVELALGIVVKRPEKRHALNVVPMKMRDENMRRKRALAKLALQFVPEYTESRAAIEDVNLVADAHFDAGGISSVAHVVGLWSGRRAAYAPKLNSHTCQNSLSITFDPGMLCDSISPESCAEHSIRNAPKCS